MTRKLMLSALSSAARSYGMAFLCGDGALAPRKLRELFMQVAGVWAEGGFVRHADAPLHDHVTRALVSVLGRFYEALVRRRRTKKREGDGDAAVALAAEVDVLIDAGEMATVLMKGVQERLGSPVPEVRLAGMRVAEAMSMLVNDDEPLRFDELRDANAARPGGGGRWTHAQARAEEDVDVPLDEFLRLVQPTLLSPTKKKEESEALSPPAARKAAAAAAAAAREADKPLKRRTTTKLVRVIGEDDSDEDSNSDSDSDSDTDSSLEALNLGDDEDDGADLEEVPPPRFVHELIDLLTTRDKQKRPQRIEAALRAAESVIRGPPVARELPEVSRRLASLLLHLPSGLHVEDETELYRLLRKRAPRRARRAVPLSGGAASDVRLLRRQPDRRAAARAARRPSTTPRFRSARSADATHRPSGPPPRGSETTTMKKKSAEGRERTAWRRRNRLSLITVDEEEERKRVEARFDVIDRRVEARARRWGQGSGTRAGGGKQGPATGVNRFAAVAGPLFFNPLVQSADRRGSGSRVDLFGRDAMLLARLLHVLGVVLECAAPSAPDLLAMARTLVDLLWVTRLHREAAVRRGTIFALSCILDALKDEDVLTELSHDMKDMLAWLTEVARQEPDADCRALAGVCLRQLLALFKRMREAVGLAAGGTDEQRRQQRQEARREQRIKEGKGGDVFKSGEMKVVGVRRVEEEEEEEVEE